MTTTKTPAALQQCSDLASKISQQVKFGSTYLKMASDPQRSMGSTPDFSSSQITTEIQEKPPQYEKLYAQGCTGRTNISPKCKDIIFTNIKNRSGPPIVYQFRPKKEKTGSLTKITVGEKNPNKPNKTILLVGETGAGKSTLINALFNYSMGVKWEDEVWCQIVEEEDNQVESQTLDLIVYEIFGFENETLPYSLTIIDTPGYGDTRGTDDDDAIRRGLIDLFKSDDGVHEVHAVGLVLKASINRLSEQQTYVFDSVMSLFGKDMEKNIIALFTHSDEMPPKNALKALEAAKIKCAKNEKGQPVHFLFNNQQMEDRTEEHVSSLEGLWKRTEKGMKEFTTFLEKSAPQNMMKTVKVMKHRIRLAASIQNLKDRIKSDELKKTEIQQIQEALMKYKEEMMKNEKFTVEVDEVYKVKEHIDAGMRLGFFYKAATCCTVCEENCHYPGCTVTWEPKHCEVMEDGHCTVCTKKCPVSVHVKENWIYVTKTRKIQKTMEDMKEKFVKNKSESENMSSLLENLKREKKQLTAKIDQWLDESYKHVVQLEQIALKADSVSTYIHLGFLIEKMIEKGDTEKVQILEEMKSRVNERTRSVLP